MYAELVKTFDFLIRHELLFYQRLDKESKHRYSVQTLGENVDYSTALIELQHSINAYRKAMLSGKTDVAKQIVSNMSDTVADLEAATNAQAMNFKKVDDLFHSTFPDAVFPDDTAIHVWRMAWQEFAKTKK